MALRALVPDFTRVLFEKDSSIVVIPTFYTYRSPSYPRRVFARIGLREGPRLRLPVGEDLEDISALWLGPEVELSARETEDLLDQLPNLRWVYSQRTGIEHLYPDSYRKRGVSVSNTGPLVSRWVAEMHLALILSFAKNIPTHTLLQHRLRGRPLPCRAMTALRVLILGTGSIGLETARLCQACGMYVVGVSRDPHGKPEVKKSFDELVKPEEALEGGESARADAVVLALPLTPETEGLIGARFLNRMRKDAALINLARPAIVDERALVRALRDGTIASAFVSRFENLSLPNRLRYGRLPNLYLTHNSEANVQGKAEAAFEQFIHLAAQPPQTVDQRVL